MSTLPKTTSANRTASPAERIRGLGRRQVGQLLIQLADLLEAGCPLSRALSAVGTSCGDSPQGELARRLEARIVNGASLAEAMEQSRHFSEAQVSMVRAAESGGFLQKMLQRLSEHAIQQTDAIKQIRAKMAYPLLLAVTALASVVFLLTWIVPRFTRIYNTADRLLPAPTRALLAVSSFLTDYWVVLLAGLVVVGLAARAALRSERVRMAWDQVVLSLPVIGRTVRDWSLSRFARTMALLLGGGGTVLRSLQLARQVVGNRVLRAEISSLADAVERGDPMSGPMHDSRFFDPAVTEMIVVSEATGKLATVMERLAAQRWRDFELRIETALSLVEPAIILLIGTIVGLTVMALLLPVLLMNTLVG